MVETTKEIDGPADRACRGSEVPLRAFWRRAGLQLSGNVAKPESESSKAPWKSQGFCRRWFNCDALPCVVKLIYLDEQRVKGMGSWLSG